MRAVVQRVLEAAVDVADERVGSIGPGLLVLVGVTDTDDANKVAKLADKVLHMRIFDDAQGIANLSVLDVGGGVLVVSQFTLYGDTRKGRRPSYIQAARPEQAEPLVAEVVARLRLSGLEVATGRFQAHMHVSSINDGPMTLQVEIH